IKIPTDSSQIISAIGEDSSHSVWIGMRSGKIFSITGRIVQEFTPQEGVPKKMITSFLEDKRGRLWYSTGDEGVYCLSNKLIYNINTDDGLSDNYVYCLTHTNSSEILAGTDRGISFIEFLPGNKKRISKVTSMDGLPDNIVRVIYPSTEADKFWIGMQDKGVALFSFSNHRIISNSATPNWRYGQVNDIIEVGDQLWIATEEKGIIQMHIGADGTLSFIKELNEWPKVSSLARDPEGNIWLAAKGDLIKSNSGRWRFINEFDNIKFKKIHCILSDQNNDLWFTPDASLVRLKMQNGVAVSKRIYHVTDPGRHIDITALYQDIYGRIWVGTMGEGAFILDPNTGGFRKLSENNITKGGHILSISGKGNEVWISSLSGVTKCSLKTTATDIRTNLDFQNFTGKVLGSSYVYDVFIDSKSRVWLATDGAGAIMISKGKAQSFGANEGLKGNVVYSITEDIYCNIWMSTLSTGLYRYDGTAFANFSITEGLSDLSVSSCMASKDGRLVVVTKKGIDILDCRTGQFLNYGKESGIKQIQSNLNAVTKDKSGNTWIGTDDGIVMYRPGHWRGREGPTVQITDVALFQNSVDTTDRKDFNYSENNFTFSFMGLYYTNPDKVKYQYILDGYNKHWSLTSDQNINFPKLGPGTYTFRVRSSTTSNFRYSDESSFQFEIEEPIWRRWWVILWICLLVVGVVYLFIRSRYKRMRRLEGLKKEKIEFEFETLKSQVNPHFLFNSFNTLINVIEEDPKLAVEYVETLSQFYRNMLSYRSKDLITLGEELNLLRTYIFLQQKRYGKALGFSVDVNGEEEQETYLPPLTLQLLAENAVKHNAISRETPLKFEVVASDGHLIIKNNINPKLTPERGEGVGLENIAHRYRLLTNQSVEFHVVGNEFVVTLPLLKAQ
ncbi:MAG: hypothetical protein C5B52_17270, partial [Bacteroidetes bacterium]